MSVLEPSADPSPERLRFQQHPANTHVGPEIHLPYCYRQLNIHEELANAAQRLVDAKVEKDLPEVDTSKSPLARHARQKLPSATKSPKRKKGGRAAAKKAAYRAVKPAFVPDGDPRYQEMRWFLGHSLEQTTGESQDNLDRAYKRFTVDPAQAYVPLSDFKLALDSLLTQLLMSFDPEIGESQLARVYDWYKEHGGKETRKGPSALADSFVKNDQRIPYSSFYVPADLKAKDTDKDHFEEDAEVERHMSTKVHDDGMANRIPSVQLPPPRERLRGYETPLTRKMMGSPHTTGKLMGGGSDSCHSPDRAFTPSTCTGGSFTPRSGTSFGTFSSRSSPTPFVASPSSPPPTGGPAMGGTRPSSAVKLPLTARNENRGGLVQEALEHEVTERELAIARENMDERWLARRHRDITDRMLGDQRHAAMGVWAERRARVEEESALNAETMRFQSELWKRGISLPADAGQDIAATAPANEELQENSHPGHCDFAATPPPRTPNVGRLSPPRHDVSQIAGEEQLVRVPHEPPSSAKPDMDLTKMNRIALLRCIHRDLLDDLAEVCEVDEAYAVEACSNPIFNTEVSTKHISLSAYTADSTREQVHLGEDTNRETEPDIGLTMHEMRFQQQQEAETVKRVLARHNCQFDAAVVESGLVMPSNVVEPSDCPFNVEPNLTIDGLPSWFVQEGAKKKKPVKPKKKAKNQHKS